MSNQVRVFCNQYAAKPEQRWLVLCLPCNGSSRDNLMGAMAFIAGLSDKKWASADWQTAQNFAAAHARAHEETRCPTCLHLPERELAPEEMAR